MADCKYWTPCGTVTLTGCETPQEKVARLEKELAEAREAAENARTFGEKIRDKYIVVSCIHDCYGGVIKQGVTSGSIDQMARDIDAEIASAEKRGADRQREKDAEKADKLASVWFGCEKDYGRGSLQAFKAAAKYIREADKD